MTSGQRYGANARLRGHRLASCLSGSELGRVQCEASNCLHGVSAGLTSVCVCLCVCLSQAMWLMLQLDEPDDFVISTGEVHSVREFVEAAFKHVGKTIV